jgi:alpha-galactosidase
MTDERLVAQARWLPQYKQAVPDAKKRLADAKRKGEYLGTHKGHGAARLPVKSVAQMRRDAAKHRRLAAAADKAAEKRGQDTAKGRKA